MSKQTITLFASFIALIFFIAPIKSHAGLLVDGGAANSGSSCLFACTEYYQQVYDGELFADNFTISEVSFFVGNTSDKWADNNEWELVLSVGNYSVNNLTNDFYENLGADYKVFSSQSFVNELQQAELITFVGDQDFSIGSDEDLLLSIRALGDLGGTALVYDTYSQGEFSQAFSYINVNNANNESLVTNKNKGLVTMFGYEATTDSTVKVSEPTSGAVFALSLVFLAGRLYKRTNSI